MKKILSSILCLLLLVSLTSCSSDSSKIIGTWECTDSHLNSLITYNGLFPDATPGTNFFENLLYDGQQLLDDWLESIYNNISLDSLKYTFFENGTCKVELTSSYPGLFGRISNTESAYGTYTFKNSILTIDGQQTRINLAKDVFTISVALPDNDTIKFRFKKIN